MSFIYFKRVMSVGTLIIIGCRLMAITTNFNKAKDLIGIIYKGSNGYILPDDERKKITDGGEEPIYGEITYQAACTLLRELKLTYKDVFYDLGSGIGKMVLQAYLTTPVKKAVGIELAQSRVWQAQKAKQQLEKMGKIQNNRYLEFYCDTITKANFEDATVVYICSTCFSQKLMEEITQMLSKLNNGLRVITLKRLPENAHFILNKEYTLPMSWYPEVLVYSYTLEK